jgi:hypothetical protein
MLGAKVVGKNKIHALCSLHFSHKSLFSELIEHTRYSVFISKFVYQTITTVV